MMPFRRLAPRVGHQVLRQGVSQQVAFRQFGQQFSQHQRRQFSGVNMQDMTDKMWSMVPTKMGNREYLVAFLAGNVVFQVLFGNKKGNVMEGTFQTRANGDALAEFYEAHDLLEVMMPLPVAFKFVMDQVEWISDPPTPETMMLTEDESRCRVHFVNMDVAFEIIREEDDNDKITYFERHERFIHYLPLLPYSFPNPAIADTTWKFGFQQDKADSSRYTVFHKCIAFSGPWFLRPIMWLHHNYIVWGCNTVVRHSSFGVDDDEAKEEHHAVMGCVPWYKFKKMLLGSKMYLSKEGNRFEKVC